MTYNAARAIHQIHLNIAMRDVQEAVQRDRTAIAWAISHIKRARHLRAWNDVAMFPTPMEVDR